MRTFATIVSMVLAAVFLSFLLDDATAQKRSYSGRLQTQQLMQRIDQLERRISALENGLHGELQVPTTQSAEQQVAVTKARLEFSRKMHGKQYISDAEFESDRYQYHRAVKTLQLARAAVAQKSTRSVAAEIEILDAEHDLAVARRQFDLARKFAGHGFQGPSGLQQHEQAVREAEAKLKFARQAKADDSNDDSD